MAIGVGMAFALGFLPPAIHSVSGTVNAQETYPLPDLAGFKPEREGTFDFDVTRDGEIDTFGRDFRNPFGDRLIQFSALVGHGGMWAIFVDKTDNEGGVTMLDGDYVLRDSDCDGLFDERLPLDTPLIMPSCFAEEE